MADCSAAGSALDRAVRTIAGGGNNDGTNKVLSNLGRHALFAQPSQHRQQLMPAHAPDHLVLPTEQVAELPQNIVDTALPPQNIQRASVAQQVPHPEMHYPPPVECGFVQHPAAPQQLHPHHQHQMMMMQQHQMMVQQQHQQQMMMMQQQQQQQQQQQMVRMQQQKQQNNASTKEADALVGHEGMVKAAGIEELAAAYIESEQQVKEQVVGGHEGLVEPAGIDQLAEAWAQAEREFHEQQIDDGNLWPHESEEETSKYDFLHKDEQLAREQKDKTDWMEEGYRHFEAGNMKEAIRSFEMELLHSDNNNASAWRMLGRCHAENDMDREAIQCFEEAVDRDPYCSEALLALGVSYVNELNHVQALANLKAWITHNPKFAGLEVGDDVYGESSGSTSAAYNSESAFDEVQRLLLRALEFHADDESMADILEALGVVYNVSRDYDAAIDAFRRACGLRPSDYQLWNKLGATLANGNKSDQALPNYHKALELKPKYARAWLNMAISHSNLEQYDEAARCYLQTLSLNPAATHCWNYLRIAVSCAERFELIPATADHDLEPFREHYDFGNPSNY